MTTDTSSPAVSLMTGPGASEIPSERLADIAIEVERLCGAVRRAVPVLAFEHEPSLFAATLAKGAR